MSNQILKKALTENQISLNDTTQQKLILYLNLITKWNRVFNLTTITDFKEMVYLHLIDSLIIQPYLQGNELLDVGTGAGLPGIPLAIANPNQQWTLLDKNSKKTRFLTQVVSELSLPNINVMHERSEDFHPAQGFDSILSRAFGSLSMFVENTSHLLKKDGIFIAMKGKYPSDEIEKLPSEFSMEQISTLDIKGINVTRHIVCIRFAHRGG